MKVEIGQLRRWNDDSGSPGELFLVIGLTEMTSSRETFVDYVMDGESHWDNDEWIERYSELIDEDR